MDMCYVCGGDVIKNDSMTLEFKVNNVLVVIHDVPGYECTKCHEKIYSLEVGKKIEAILQMIKQTSVVCQAEFKLVA